MKQQSNIVIVYGVYINASAHWRKLIRQQLEDVRRSGVLSVSDLHVVVSNPSQANGVAEFFEELPIEIAHIEIHNENKFEYPAIFHLWSLANRSPDHQYIAYLHTKGMSYAKRRRNKVERALTFFSFSEWPRIVSIFDKIPQIQKIGLFPAAAGEKPLGWMWFNFWWARSSFLRTLPKPEQQESRYSYETWLGHSTTAESHSILGDRSTLYSSDDAQRIVKLLARQLKYGPLHRIRDFFSLRNYRAMQTAVGDKLSAERKQKLDFIDK